MITVQKADSTNFHPGSMDDFSRMQAVTNVFRLADGKLNLVYQPFTEDWKLFCQGEITNYFPSFAFILFCSTILEKSEPNPDWEWVRISLFPLKYRGVIDF